MYRALYRKWRPAKFEDVVGQHAIVTALQNQISTDHVGHAYLFTGVRGTGKTTCAKIFAKAVNCLHPNGGDPCGECEICRGIDNGSVLDVVEMDAASNNGVDDIRDIRDETNYTPSQGKYKVYIIDEVHMLSGPAFNALLKTLEEPPSHVIFILATTEIQKVPATILSRCQRYDFGRIRPEDIAGRVAQIAEAENIGLTPGAAELLSRLADGALRDALSILDTCAGVSAQVDEDVVRRMAGVTDKSYLFRMSDFIAAGNAVGALAELAELRQNSVDVKRLCEELIGHYRNLMLAAVPGGENLLSGVSPAEIPQYVENARRIPQHQSIRAIGRLGEALEKMGRGTDQRVELELALFSLSRPEAVPNAPAAAAVPVMNTSPASTVPKPFASAPVPFASAPITQSAPVPKVQSAPAPENISSVFPRPAAPAPVSAADAVLATEAPPWEAEPLAPLPQEEAPPEQALESAPIGQPEYPADKPLAHSRPDAALRGIQPFPAWEQVLAELEGRDAMLTNFLKGSHAFFDGKRVLIECGNTFREFIRTNKDSQELIKTIITKKTGVRCGIGPYTAPKQAEEQNGPSMEQTLEALQNSGVAVEIHEKE